MPRFIFFGTPQFAAIVLEQLLEAGMIPAAVICNPDRPVGRKKVITAPAVKQLIKKYEIRSKKYENIQILQPESLTSYNLSLTSLNPDFAIVAAYANIIPKEMLAIPRLGTIGVHPSLLPKYRGASPIQSAILRGEKETGVTLYLMDEKMDHGATLATRKAPARTTEILQSGRQIANGDTYQTLEEKLAKLGGELLMKTIPDFVAGKIVPQPQDHTKATFTKKFQTKDGEVDLTKDDPETIFRKIRALNPEPGVYTFTYPGHEGKRVKFLRAEFQNNELRILEIQVEGKKPQTLTARGAQ